MEKGEYLQSLEFARKRIAQARRNMDVHGACLRAGDDMYTGVMWAIDAWLHFGRHPIEPPRMWQSGWEARYFQFSKLAPEEMSAIAGRVLANCVMLTGPGDMDDPDEPPRALTEEEMEQQRERTRQRWQMCLELSKRFLAMIEANLNIGEQTL